MGQHPFTVAIHAGHGSDTWTRETIEKAIGDAYTFIGVAESTGKPLMATVRDRRGVLLHKLETADYTPASMLRSVPS